MVTALNGYGDSHEQVVRAQDVLEYVGRTVPRLTGQLQHPRHSTNYLDEFPMACLKHPAPALRLPDPRGSSLEYPVDSGASFVQRARRRTGLRSTYLVAVLTSMRTRALTELLAVQLTLT